MLYYLISGHFLCDFMFQSDTIAKYKNFNVEFPGVPWYYWMLSHCVIQGLSVAIVTNSIILGIAETIIHFAIDCAKCANYTNIHIDQALHIICRITWYILCLN